MAAATSCHSTALFLLPTRQESRYAVVSSYSAGQSQLSHRFGLSFRAERGFKARKPVVVSSLRDDSKTVTSKTWDKLILKSDTPVLVEFYANWCGPCRMVHRVIEEIANVYSGRLNCFLLDADNDPQIAEKYEIKAVPVVLLFKNGEKREAVMGTMPKEYYVAAIESVMAS